MSIQIGVTGDNESFTHLAGKSFFASLAPTATYSFFNDLKTLFKGLGEGNIEYAITALESSSYGTIHAVYDKLLLSQGRFTIVGEIGQIEQHCLCVKADFTGTESDLVKVFSHPHIVECCNDYLETIDNRRKNANLPPLERGNTWDSAASCREVASSTVASACICSKEAAELHGLKILTSSIGNYKNAETRYVIVARVSAENTVHDPLNLRQPKVHSQASRIKSAPKCSLAMALRNIPGSIFKMSSCFAFRNLDIVKIESRPATISYNLNFSSNNAIISNVPAAENTPASSFTRPFTQKHWDLIFYIDYEPSEMKEVNESLMNNLKEYCMWIVNLGSYQNGLHSLDHQPSEWSTMKEVVSF